MRNVLEAQLPTSQRKPNAAPATSPTSERITTRTDIRQFDSFLRSINHCSSLLDARRLKNDIEGEIRRTRVLLGRYEENYLEILLLYWFSASHERDDWINGERTEDVVAFLDRLYTAKRKVEERIVVLGGEDVSVRSHQINDDQ